MNSVVEGPTERQVCSLMKLVFNFFGCRDPHRKHKRHRAVSGQMFLVPIGEKMSKFTMKADSDGCRAVIQGKDKRGNPAPFFGVPQWSMSADGIVDMTVDADGLGANFVPTDAAGALGIVHVVAKAEGEPTPGDQVITIEGDIEVIAADAETGDMSFAPITPPPGP